MRGLHNPEGYWWSAGARAWPSLTKRTVGVTRFPKSLRTGESSDSRWSQRAAAASRWMSSSVGTCSGVACRNRTRSRYRSRRDAPSRFGSASSCPRYRRCGGRAREMSWPVLRRGRQAARNSRRRSGRAAPPCGRGRLAFRSASTAAFAIWTLRPRCSAVAPRHCGLERLSGAALMPAPARATQARASS
jgi:hypothetical protein